MAADSYASLPVFDVDEDEPEEDLVEVETKEEHLSTSEKIQIARPLLVRYMLPLFFVYLAGTSYFSQRNVDIDFWHLQNIP